MRSTCRHCYGTRLLVKTPCVECDGKGNTIQRRRITVPVPAGVYHIIRHCYYRPRSRGDNMFGSVHVCACVCVRLTVGTLLFELFDLTLIFGMRVDLDLG